MKNKTKQLLSILFVAITFAIFLSCDNQSILLNQVLQSTPNSIPYTATLHRISSVENFGIGAESPNAIEFADLPDGNKQLYMIASTGLHHSRGEYLFRLDKNTGIAEYVNKSAIDLGGSFKGSKNFIRLKGVSPTDMTWVPPHKSYIEGIDYPIGYLGTMMAICPVTDQLLGIDIKTGYAMGTRDKSQFCITDEDNAPIGGNVTLAYQGHLIPNNSGGTTFFMTAGSRIATRLYMTTGNRCATDLGLKWGSKYPENREGWDGVMLRVKTYPPAAPNFDVGEAFPTALCYDNNNLYMSGADTQSFYQLNTETGQATLIGRWNYAKGTPGVEKSQYDKNQWKNTYKNAYSFIQITGLAFDNKHMYAVDAFTNALYKVEMH